jgi:hypothetical protein
MSTNPLRGRAGTGCFTSKISALDWSRMAEAKGLPRHAKAWRQAYSEGWDEAHYRPDPVPEFIPDRKMIAAGDRY